MGADLIIGVLRRTRLRTWAPFSTHEISTKSGRYTCSLALLAGCCAGTTSRGHLAENLAAADLALADDEIASLTNAFS